MDYGRLGEYLGSALYKGFDKGMTGAVNYALKQKAEEERERRKRESYLFKEQNKRSEKKEGIAGSFTFYDPETHLYYGQNYGYRGENIGEPYIAGDGAAQTKMKFILQEAAEKARAKNGALKHERDKELLNMKIEGDAKKEAARNAARERRGDAKKEGNNYGKRKGAGGANYDPEYFKNLFKKADRKKLQSLIDTLRFIKEKNPFRIKGDENYLVSPRLDEYIMERLRETE